MFQAGQANRKLMNAVPSISLVVIARNESRCMERCLLSAKRFVDRIVVLDTGSTDDTISIATSCGAEVHQATWGQVFLRHETRHWPWQTPIETSFWTLTSGSKMVGQACRPPDSHRHHWES